MREVADSTIVHILRWRWILTLDDERRSVKTERQLGIQAADDVKRCFAFCDRPHPMRKSLLCCGCMLGWARRTEEPQLLRVQTFVD